MTEIRIASATNEPLTVLAISFQARSARREDKTLVTADELLISKSLDTTKADYGRFGSSCAFVERLLKAVQWTLPANLRQLGGIIASCGEDVGGVTDVSNGGAAIN